MSWRLPRRESRWCSWSPLDVDGGCAGVAGEVLLGGEASNIAGECEDLRRGDRAETVNLGEGRAASGDRIADLFVHRLDGPVETAEVGEQCPSDRLVLAVVGGEGADAAEHPGRSLGAQAGLGAAGVQVTEQYVQPVWLHTHTATHHAAAIDLHGRLLGDAEFAASPAGYAQLLSWLRARGQVQSSASKAQAPTALAWPATSTTKVSTRARGAPPGPAAAPPARQERPDRCPSRRTARTRRHANERHGSECISPHWAFRLLPLEARSPCEHRRAPSATATSDQLQLLPDG